MGFEHVSVLLNECINGLNIMPNGIYVDATLGGAGHAFSICSHLSKEGQFVGIDQDDNAIMVSKQRLAGVVPKVTIIKSNFEYIESVLDMEVDGILMDLGVSSHQLDEASRGFSYMHDATLDMRMNQDSDLSAYDVVNGYEEDKLALIIKSYGEEKWAKRIAKFIVDRRPLNTTYELVEVIKNAIPQSARREGSHPAKRTFQAIRIEVNRELDIIAPTIKAAVNRLNVGGRLCIITFHSLEDRIVKHTFRELENPCICPPIVPICSCGNVASVKVVTRKPILPTDKEIETNPRARSAKLRIIEKIA
ncbi:MAG: ribosomal RNA small subunit methyltransferase H [Epulopiscium sp. Nele67-Bin002]|nr:MAG: ribosomal RNA small subunit methyltransferase H [Epulopiscium sp. Nele67-Bin002]OON94618.1 MAG: 16S rRNA (cytosine(1402)-N(4))-methyltransferase [Epulopiscium sp. Nele67-Bin001]